MTHVPLSDTTPHGHAAVHAGIQMPCHHICRRLHETSLVETPLQQQFYDSSASLRCCVLLMRQSAYNIPGSACRATLWMRRTRTHISCASHMRGRRSLALDLRGCPHTCGVTLGPHAGAPSMISAETPTLARLTTEGPVQVGAGHPEAHALSLECSLIFIQTYILVRAMYFLGAC